MSRRPSNRASRSTTTATTGASGAIAGGAIAALLAMAPATFTVTFGPPAPTTLSAQPDITAPYNGEVCPRAARNGATG